MVGAGERHGYHHGDARNALIAAAADLIEQAGAAGLSLRQVAERAGLSRQAPYNHFADKEALLAELVRDGFERLASAMRATDGAAAGGDALVGAADAYISFAQHAPARFRMMFSREIVDLARFPAAATAASDAFSVLSAIIAAFAPPERVPELSLAAWSIVHGYATLWVEVDVEPSDWRPARASLFASIIRAGAA